MTTNEKALFAALASLGDAVAGILDVQAETNRLLADKLPNVSGEAKAALKVASTLLSKRAKTFAASAKKLTNSIPS